MNNLTSHSPSNSHTLPAPWRDAAGLRLRSGENVLAWLEVDLNAQLHFSQGLVIITDQRVLDMADAVSAWQEWSYDPKMSMLHHDHAGVGTLELVNDQAQLASWRYTLGQNIAALRLIDQFNRQLDSHITGQPITHELEAICPKCKAPLEEDQDECPICTRENQTPPSTWTLFRLWRFARPYRGQLLAGFLLTLASTAASLVPPYLTMPLMDKVLIPYQNGQRIDVQLVTLLLGGLLGSALLAWSLGWAKTYILALVSERIGADLRTTTYEHLLSISLEYFGGKSTGDLM